MIYRQHPSVVVHSLDPLEDMTAMLQGMMARPTFRSPEVVPPIKIDVSEDERTYIVKAEIPGAQKENIRVSIEGNRVSISAEVNKVSEEKPGQTLLHSERYRGVQSRTFTLACEIDEKEAEAKYEHGVLALTLPKKSATRMKQLSVQ